MANQFRVDRVGMEIKREVNEILQKKFVIHVFKELPLQMCKCWATCQWQKCTTR